jgi:hypothetical protein
VAKINALFFILQAFSEVFFKKRLLFFKNARTSAGKGFCTVLTSAFGASFS